MKRKDLIPAVTLAVVLGFFYWLLFVPSRPNPAPNISRADRVLCTMAAVDEYPLDAVYSLIDQLTADQHRRELLAACEAKPEIRALISPANKEP